MQVCYIIAFDHQIGQGIPLELFLCFNTDMDIGDNSWVKVISHFSAEFLRVSYLLCEKEFQFSHFLSKNGAELGEPE